MEDIIFRSRISILVLVIVLTPLMYMFIISIVKNKADQRLLYVVLPFTILLMGWLMAGTRYVISEEKLHVKIGFIPSRSANITDIVSVERSYNSISSPAFSLKRLHIHFKDSSSSLLISPARETEFIEALKAVNPDIEVSIPEKTGRWWRIWDWDI